MTTSVLLFMLPLSVQFGGNVSKFILKCFFIIIHTCSISESLPTLHGVTIYLHGVTIYLHGAVEESHRVQESHYGSVITVLRSAISII